MEFPGPHVAVQGVHSDQGAQCRSSTGPVVSQFPHDFLQYTPAQVHSPLLAMLGQMGSLSTQAVSGSAGQGGRSLVEHVVVSVFSPSQLSPPLAGAGLSQARDLDLTPAVVSVDPVVDSAHVTLQGVHSDH